MSAERMIITGGQGSLAQSIRSYFLTRNPDMIIDSPTRDEWNVCDPQQGVCYASEHPCDLLICCAGKSDHGLLAKMSETTWSEIIDCNLTGAMRSAKEVSRGMIKQRRGHIVFMSSYSAAHPPMGQAAYATAKAGLLGLTKSLAKEWGRYNVRVNAVLPGFLNNHFTKNLSDQRKQLVMTDHVLGRYNTELAVATFLETLHFHLIHTSGQIFNLDSRIL